MREKSNELDHFARCNSAGRALRTTLALCAAVGMVDSSPRRRHTPNRWQSGELPLVVVLSTGGTIAGRGGSTTSLTEIQVGLDIGFPSWSMRCPKSRATPGGASRQIANIGSTNMNPCRLAETRDTHQRDFRGGPASGRHRRHAQNANTFEETAYFLNLTVRHDKPVVLVGAQQRTGVQRSAPMGRSIC